MSLFRITLKLLIRINIVLSFAYVLGCGSANNFTNFNNTCETQSPSAGASNVSVFLNIVRHGAVPDVTLNISSIELLVDDVWVPFASSLTKVNTKDTNLIQKYLGRQWLKGHLCRGIRVHLLPAEKPQGGGEMFSSPMASYDAEMLLDNPVVLEASSRKILFLEWNPAKNLSNTAQKLVPLSAYSGGYSRVTTNLLFVACPDIDAVYVIGTDKFQVVDIFAVNGRPTYLAVDPDGKKIYVLAESLNKIIPYDITTHLPGNEIVVPLANVSNFMMVKNSTHTAYVIDSLGILTSIDLLGGNMLNRNRIGNSPNYVTYIEGFNKLAVSSTLDQTVYLVNPISLAVEDSIALGSSPSGVLGYKNYLYIAEGSANTVSIYDLSTRMMLKQVHVGFEPIRFVSTENSVYVSNYIDGTISLMQGEQFSISKELRVGINVKEMAVAEKQRLLFAVEEECEGALAVIDTTANQIVGRVELGVKPSGIALIE